MKESFRESKEEDWEIHELAFLVNTLALVDYAQDHCNLDPQYCVGSSYGDLIGAAYTESLSFSDALWLSYECTLREKRYSSEYLDQYVTDFIYRYPAERVEEWVKIYKGKGRFLELSSNMSKDLVAVSGEREIIQELKRSVRKEGGISLYTMERLIHCSKLKEIKKTIDEEVHSRVTFRPASIPFISDIDGTVFDEPEKIKELLLGWFDSPVRLDLTKTTMKELGIEKVFVIGPRNIFGTLLRDEFSIQIISPDNVE